MAAPLKILSIQSDVVAGHVGHAAARPALQSLGIELLALPAVLFSNHPGHGGFRGKATPAEDLTALLEGLEERGFLDGVAAVHSGYLGDAAQAGVVRDAVLRVKQRNPEARYLLDPVFGDEGGAYARPGVAEAMARLLLPLADIVAPNRFELASLTSRRIESAADAIAAARQLGRPMVLATSIPMGGDLGIAMVTPDGAKMVAHGPRLPHAASGAGDVLAALFLGRLALGETSDAAALKALRSVYALIAAAGDAKDLPLVAHHEWLAAPPDGPIAVTML